MDQYALFNHVSRGREVPEDGPQAFNTVHYVSRTAKPIALIGLGSLQISRLRDGDTQDERFSPYQPDKKRTMFTRLVKRQNEMQSGVNICSSLPGQNTRHFVFRLPARQRASELSRGLQTLSGLLFLKLTNRFLFRW
jgi:hypothetical protein